ncbi:hypothetical protein D3C80_2122200 [compost metagenome]
MKSALGLASTSTVSRAQTRNSSWGRSNAKRVSGLPNTSSSSLRLVGSGLICNCLSVQCCQIQDRGHRWASCCANETGLS